ncbi:MAG: XrtA/PEP-CTERM system-associated ATPase [Pseudomonadota bacterium]
MYEDFFGLSAKPFQLSPDASFFYPSKEHRRALSFLEYGLSQADGFIVITGDVGTGKTTLVHTLLNSLDVSELLTATIVTTQLEESDLLELVARNFGLKGPFSTKASLLGELEALFRQQAIHQRRVLLIVDEAQNLPPRSVEELRMLSNFLFDGKPLVQVFLLGQEEFRGTLLSEGFEQLRQRVIATYHLNPLNREETQTYIEHRLRTVGWLDSPVFGEGVFDAIFEFCEGVPRRINNLCDRLLLFAFLEDSLEIQRSMVDSVAEEIGSEFWGGRTDTAKVLEPSVPAAPTEHPTAADVFRTPGQPLETMARVMFDKANVQQRLASIERAVDLLGHDLKPQLTELRDDLAFVRLMLEELISENREDAPGVSNNAKPSAQKKNGR